jgi:hypothetical protein
MASLLSQCSAYLITRNEKEGAALMRLAARLGFGHAEQLASPHEQPAYERPMRFFLMYRHLSEDVMVNIRNIIRRSEDRNVQFSPIILFTEECDFDTYVRYVKIGFDDVLTLPDKRDMLVARLENQITSEHIYFETADYLGPDRRRLELPGQTDPRRGGESRSYSRHLVQRSVTEGSRPIRSDLLSNTPLAMRAGGGMY